MAHLLLGVYITYFILVLQVSFWDAVHLSFFIPSFMVTYMTEKKIRIKTISNLKRAEMKMWRVFLNFINGPVVGNVIHPVWFTVLWKKLGLAQE